VEGPPDSIAVPVVWSSPEDVPILYANTFVCQFEQTLDSFILTVGQLTPPALIAATPEELREQAENIAFVVVKTVARFGLTPSQGAVVLLDEGVARRRG
jgi:hypothetical protein